MKMFLTHETLFYPHAGKRYEDRHMQWCVSLGGNGDFRVLLRVWVGRKFRNIYQNFKNLVSFNPAMSV